MAQATKIIPHLSREVEASGASTTRKCCLGHQMT
jgi:hypothetical protein